eukprot:1076698-Pleurochrysis_carterae.AAC.1
MAHEKPASRCSTAGLAGPSTAKKQSDREYLEEHALDIYLTDVTKLLLKRMAWAHKSLPSERDLPLCGSSTATGC